VEESTSGGDLRAGWVSERREAPAITRKPAVLDDGKRPRYRRWMDDPSKIFEKDVGTWDAEIEVRPHPGAEPQRSTGVSVNRLVGGRWLVADFKNDTTGFDGHGVYGWDASKQKYVGTWVDPMRSSLVVAEGSWDGRMMTYQAEITVGERLIRWREVTETIDDRTQVFRSWMALPDGGEFEMMTVTYKKR
jgi:hypothetical protein